MHASKENGVLTPQRTFQRRDFPQEGVAVVIFNADGHLLLVQQNQSEPEYKREAGQWSIPIETKEKGERPHQTFRRLFEEELGVTDEQMLRHFVPVKGSYRETTVVYERWTGLSFKCRIAAAQFTGPSCTIFSARDRVEIRETAWVAPNDLSSFDMELGARLVAECYLHGNNNA